MNLLRRSRLSLLLAAVAVAGLAYDAKVHLHLAGDYDAVGSTITQGWLFRIEAAIAIAIAIALLVSDHRLVWAAAGLIGLAGVGAVLLYRYVDVGAIGPIPNMYEPVWFAEKLRSAYAEGAVAAIWLVREGVRARA
ncbi:MAG: hypothetical protein QOJ79_638 [Actinomycetota bacterium]|jgi:hypothetical protein|nr:hypothetical protein [Actinomycetota bacterium]